MTRWLVLALLVAVPAAAQDVPFDQTQVQACLDSASPSTCVGDEAAACSAQTGSNVGYGFCLRAELTFWDAELNRVYGVLIDLTEAQDAELKSYGSAAPAMTPALRAAQRAWIAWRDAQCDFIRTTFGGGTGGNPAATDCLMRLTAEQALRLDAELAGQGR
ncbi:Uncharacterized conserved protein YecT, DUF1311 family [Jannaschia faecimaris]|uniref:Uncharacterized conserved protein YecT, DUF1311 family n=1 Tax=Jannaschia faecimaris TaxID=1244108 RepID=A0A1H3PTH6_9RHOB|nr:lysozyme inhibitor LprI family protein [Jannaschia faecimaris]SDZ04584.1 Uncharacterized conserved protein YecT, DUF1311 family [Jannaschia faecimaris]